MDSTSDTHRDKICEDLYYIFILLIYTPHHTFISQYGMKHLNNYNELKNFPMEYEHINNVIFLYEDNTPYVFMFCKIKQ